MRFLMPVAIAAVLTTAYLANAQVGTTSPNEHTEHESGAAGATKPVDMAKHMQMMNKMMVQHLGKGDPQYDARFIDLMIPHHEGAVMMARHALKHSQRPELKAMAEKVIKDQQKEIEQMKQWRKAWYGENPAKPAEEAAR
jgi:uncharacterized protein (DUF305 family)